ncbi:MAG: hypothetical protein LBR80_09990 [Deltaproteobacteria bacterium]|nr:hypothetical protein [Deltaproteobacteria bacterium]
METVILSYSPVPPGLSASPAEAWALVSGFIGKELPAEAAFALARPGKAVGGTVAWLTSLEGLPRELSALTGPERAAAEQELRRRAEEFAGLGGRLSSATSPDARAAARLLSRLSASLAAAAVGIPGPERIFVVGGVPVLCSWWRPPAEEARAWAVGPPVAVASGSGGVAVSGEVAAAGSSPLAGAPMPLAPSARPVPPVTVAAQVSAPPASETPVYAPSPPAYGSPPATAGSGLGRMAVAASAAFVLALFLFALLSADIRKAAASIPVEAQSVLSDPAIESGLRAELDALRSRYDVTLLGCSREDTPRIEDGSPDLPEPVRRSMDPPSAGDGPAALEAASPPPPPTPPPLPKPKPKPKPKPRPKPVPRYDPNDCGCG